MELPLRVDFGKTRVRIWYSLLSFENEISILHSNGLPVFTAGSASILDLYRHSPLDSLCAIRQLLQERYE